MIIAICGPGKCGKASACQWFAKHTNLRYAGSTSRFAANAVFEHMQTLGICYKDEEDCYNNRESHRQIWADVINEINSIDRTTLYRTCLASCDLLDGIRNKDDLQACKDAKLVDLTIWIERHVRNDPTMNFGSELCDIIIENKHDFDAFYSRLHNLSRCLGILRSS